MRRVGSVEMRIYKKACCLLLLYTESEVKTALSHVLSFRNIRNGCWDAVLGKNKRSNVSNEGPSLERNVI